MLLFFIIANPPSHSFNVNWPDSLMFTGVYPILYQ